MTIMLSVLKMVFILLLVLCSTVCRAQAPVLTWTGKDLAPENMLHNMQFQMYSPRGWVDLPHINLGYRSGPLWLRVHLLNVTANNIQRLLEIDNPRLEEVQIWQVTPKGEQVSLEVRHHAPFVFSLSIPAHTGQTWLLQIRSRHQMILPIQLVAPKSLVPAQIQHAWDQGGFYGALLGLWLSTFLSWWLSRELVLFWLSVNLLPLIGLLLGSEAVLSTWGIHTPLEQMNATFWLGIENTLIPLFIRSYLGLGRIPVFSRILGMVSAISLAAAVLALFENPMLLRIILRLFTIAHLVVFPFEAFWSWRRHQGVSRFMLLSWILFFVVAGGIMLLLGGWWPDHAIWISLLKGALIASVLLVTLGIGLRILEIQQERQNAERSIVRAEAQHAAQSEFMTTISHELRNPLGAVLGSIEQLRLSGLTEEQQRLLVAMVSSSESLLNIINDLFDYSLVEAGQITLEQREFDLQALLVDILAIFKAKAYQKGLILLCSVSARTPQRVVGDAVRLRQVLLNLVSNALTHTERGRIDVMVSSRRTSMGVRIECAVKDTGEGISPERLAHVFEPFAKGQSDAQLSSGIGLTVCRKLCRLMGGDISVESHLMQGSTFSFWIEMGVGKTPVSRQEPWSGQICRMLLLDQDPEYLELMQREARLPDLLIDTADSLEECQKLLAQRESESHPYHLLIASLQLKDGNSLGLRSMIASYPQHELAGLVITTEPYWQPNPGLLRQAGISSAFARPVMAYELIKIISEYFQRERLDQFWRKNQQRETPWRVAVLEHRSGSRSVVVAMLEHLGIVPEVFVDTHQFQMLMQQNPGAVDLLLLDCEIEDVDPFDFVRQWRSHEAQLSLHRLPVLGMTNLSSQTRYQECMAAGLSDLVFKPVQVHELKSRLEYWLDVQVMP